MDCPATNGAPHCYCQGNKCCFCNQPKDAPLIDFDDDGSEENKDA